MSYLDDVEKELRGILDSDESDAEKWGEQIVQFVRGKLLESFKNGVATERQRRQKPKQKSKASK